MQRFYSFKIVTYNSLEYVEAFSKLTSHYAYILHDKDLKEDGTLQSEHYHVLCTFTSNKSFESVRKLMGGPENTFVHAMTDKFGDYLYLTHKNAPEKYQYPDDIIITNSQEFFISSTEKTISNDEFINDISPYSMLSKLDLARKYGRDYIKNSRTYHEFAKNAFVEQYFIERGFSDNICLLTYDSFLFDMFIHYLIPFFSSFPPDVRQILFGEVPLELGELPAQNLNSQFINVVGLPKK